eukprot:Skav203501  [mRNA]  locus=scaffold2089:138558:141399:- [translate_table: standard]
MTTHVLEIGYVKRPWAYEFLLAATDGSLEPELQQAWSLPCAATALAALVLPNANVIAVAGTQNGDLHIAGPGEEVLTARTARAQDGTFHGWKRWADLSSMARRRRQHESRGESCS